MLFSKVKFTYESIFLLSPVLANLSLFKNTFSLWKNSFLQKKSQSSVIQYKKILEKYKSKTNASDFIENQSK